MAENVAVDIDYFIAVKAIHKDKIVPLRAWSNLKIGLEDDTIWLKGFDFTQLSDTCIKVIPEVKIYYEKNGRLFKLGSLLPDVNAPSLIWMPIARLVKLSLPSFNHNYFGLNEKIEIKLTQTSVEQKDDIMLLSTESLHQFISTAPAIRLSSLNWMILNNDYALVFGTPMLPLNGETFWKRGNSILPAGFDFELYLMHQSIDSYLNPDKDNFIFWRKDGSYSLLEKDKLSKLSISSFRKSMEVFNLKVN